MDKMVVFMLFACVVPLAPQINAGKAPAAYEILSYMLTRGTMDGQTDSGCHLSFDYLKLKKNSPHMLSYQVTATDCPIQGLYRVDVTTVQKEEKRSEIRIAAENWGVLPGKDH